MLVWLEEVVGAGSGPGLSEVINVRSLLEFLLPCLSLISLIELTLHDL